MYFFKVFDIHSMIRGARKLKYNIILKYLGGQAGNQVWKVSHHWIKSSSIGNPRGHNIELWACTTVKLCLRRSLTWETRHLSFIKGNISWGSLGNQSSIFVAPTTDVIQHSGPYLPFTWQLTLRRDAVRSLRKVSLLGSEEKEKELVWSLPKAGGDTCLQHSACKSQEFHLPLADNF